MNMRTLGCAACAALLFLVAAGPAGAKGQGTEAEPILEAAASVSAGAEAEGASAVAGSVAAEEVDVDASPVVQEVDRDALGRTIATYYCRTLSVARVHRTFLGFVAFKFWQRKRWCWRYPRILSTTVSTYITNVDPNFQYKGVVSSSGNWYVWCCGNPYSGQTSFREARFTNCILKIGCVGEYYPWVRINARANGSYAYTTGS